MARSRSSYVRSSFEYFAQLFRRRRRASRQRGASSFSRPRRLGTAFEPLELRAMLDGSPSFGTIADQAVLGGAPTWLGITGAGTSGNALTYSVSVSNPSLLQAIIPTGNKSLVLNTSGAETGVTGQMTFQLFDNLVPDVTSHIESLVNSGDFNNSSSLPVNFYRISHEGDGSDFVIQGGPQFSSGNSPLGQFDDEFNPDLQFTTSGLLAMAKSTDDTNDSQIFVTGAPTRFLDFQHSIFGVITAGESVRQAIQHSTATGDGAPPSTISITSAQIITDTTNAALELKAARGASGTSDVTVTVTDSVTGQTFAQTFHVTVTPDTQSPAPYLNKIAPVSGTQGQPISVQLSATDVTGGTDVFDAVKPSSETTNYSINVDHSTGLVTLTPPADFTGTFHVTMSVKGSGARTTADQSDTQDVAVTVASAVLGANNDTATVSENASATTINVLSNDTGNGLTITAVGTPTAGGTASISSDSRSISYTPAANFQGQDTFTYTVKDGTGATGTATATVTVSATTTTTPTTGTLSGFVYFDVNNNGVFDAGELAIGDVTITLIGKKTSDNSSVNLTMKTASDGSYSFSSLDPGSYTIKETQSTFIIDGKETIGSQGGTAGSDQFTITVTAGTAGTNNNFGEVGRDITTISIKDFFASNSQNNGIAAFDSSGNELWHTLDSSVWQGFSGETFSATSSALNVSATNPDAQPVSASLSTSSPAVQLIVQSGGNSLYRLTTAPTNLDFTSPGTSETNPSGNSSTNSTPTANNDAYSTAFNTPLTIAATGVLSNDTDPNNKSLTATASTQPAHGTLTFNSNGSFTYTPTSGFSGSDSFTYTATNGTQSSSAATVTITIAAAGAPTIIPHTYSTNQNTPLTILAGPGVLSGAADPQSLSITAAAVSQPVNGTLSLAADGSFVYTPASGFSGTDSFTYTASDSNATSQPATVTITVNASTAPTAKADSFSVTEDAPFTTNPGGGVLTNDTDPQNSTLTAAVATQPIHGTLSFSSDGSFTYTPETGFTGSDSFTYTATNPSSQTSTATVTLTVSPPNHAPVATADSYATDENQALTTTQNDGLLVNDSDADNQTLTADIVDQPQHGTISLSSDGTFTYTPATNFSGTDTFTYQASDGHAPSATTTVTITVNHVDQPPTASADTYALATNGTLDIPRSQGVLTNDTDPDNDSLTAIQVSDAANGTVSVGPDGSFTYVPDADFTGDDTFTYKVNDGNLDSNVVTVTITVGPTSNVAPLAINDSYTVLGAALTIGTDRSVLLNDIDANGDSLNAQLIIAPTHGSVTLNPDGSFSYTADAGFTGDDSFEYQANDNQSNSNLAKVTITVNPASGEANSDPATAHDAALLSLLADGMLS
jgi:VCBS repeat-containing protein